METFTSMEQATVLLGFIACLAGVLALGAWIADTFLND